MIYVVIPPQVVDATKGDRGLLSPLGIGIVSSSFFGIYGVLFLMLPKHIMLGMSDSLYSNVGLNTYISTVFGCLTFAWDNLALWGGSAGFRSISKSPKGVKFQDS